MLHAGGEFPRRDRLLQGAILGTLATLIGGPGDDQRWEGPTYLVDYMDGDKAAITFVRDQIVGLLFDHTSPRNPWSSEDTSYNYDSYTHPMPSDLYDLAVIHTLQYMTERWDIERGPVITAAFWGEGERLTAVESWQEVWQHGAHILYTQLLDPAAAVAEWQQRYDLSSEEVLHLKRLFELKVTNMDRKIALHPSDYRLLIPEAGYYSDVAKKSLTGIGIKTP